MSIKIYDGSSWKTVDALKVFDGSSWQSASNIKVFNGSAWQDSNIGGTPPPAPTYGVVVYPSPANVIESDSQWKLKNTSNVTLTEISIDLVAINQPGTFNQWTYSRVTYIPTLLPNQTYTIARTDSDGSTPECDFVLNLTHTIESAEHYFGSVVSSSLRSECGGCA